MDSKTLVQDCYEVAEKIYNDDIVVSSYFTRKQIEEGKIYTDRQQIIELINFHRLKSLLDENEIYYDLYYNDEEQTIEIVISNQKTHQFYQIFYINQRKEVYEIQFLSTTFDFTGF